MNLKVYYLSSSLVGVGSESFLLSAGWNAAPDAAAASARAAGWLTAILAGRGVGAAEPPAAPGTESHIS